MSETTESFESRKLDHIRLSLDPRTETYRAHQLDDVVLPHQAIPDLDFDKISIKTQQLGCEVETPFLVSSMTAGHKDANTINARLMEAAQHCGWSMGVGSQRRELFDPNAHLAWQSLRQTFPKLRLFGNIGIAQLIDTKLSALQRLIDNIEANALQVHLNPLQEVIQPEGNTHFAGARQALEQLSCSLSIPLIVKETGCGISKNTLQWLDEIGVAAVDVSGFGGTHWGRIEGYRAECPIRQRAAQTFRNWGISTTAGIKSAYALEPSFEIWGSGGVRNGLDSAKLIALGANTIGVARPLMAAAVESVEQIIEVMQTFMFELKVALFCTGSANLPALRKVFHEN